MSDCLPMSTLILALDPSSGASTVPEYDFVLTDAQGQPLRQGRAAAALLPATGSRDVLVAVVPAQRLSWHCVTVPQPLGLRLLRGRMEPQQQRSVLAGLLEEQLLDDVQDLHFALFAAPDNPAALWVAVCDRAWLAEALHDLAAAGREPALLVAQASPRLQGPAQAWVHSAPEVPAQVLLSTAQGVCSLPLGPAAQALAGQQAQIEVLSEPAVSPQAEQLSAHGVHLHTAAQQLVRAAESPWNLLQLEFSPSRQRRWQRNLRSGLQTLLTSPAWQPVRWGVAALVVLQLLALNAMAWRENSLLQQQREAVHSVLTQTFPDVGLVIDAPLQMQRSVQALALARGEGAGLDLARVLAVLAPFVTPELDIGAVDLQSSELRLVWKVAGDGSAVVAALASQGYRATLQDGVLQIQARGAP
jgi:general secretion pathway protein L